MTIMSEEEYLDAHGYGFMGYAEPALHRQPGSDQKRRSKRATEMAERAAQHDLRREELRLEYREKVRKGELRPPSRIERLRAAAAGHPDNEATQAAQRLLKKMGL